MPEIEAFCRGVYPGLVGTLRLQCGDAELAEDLAQEALTRAWERWESVSRMEDPKGWVFRVAYNLANSERRRRVVAERFRSVLGLSGVSSEASDQIVDVQDALLKLPERQRTALVLRHYLQLSVAEASEVMGCAQGTVKSLCHKAREFMRSELAVEPRGGDRGR